MTERQTAIIPIERVQKRILVIRGQKVILDSDLASLYGVSTARLNEQVKRNKARFPEEFIFQLNKEEFKNLMSQFAISRSPVSGWGGRRIAPYAFTEHGAIMAASVLNSERAVQVSIYVVRAFVQLRLAISANREIVSKLQQLEQKTQKHDKQIGALITAIRQLLQPPAEIKPKMPFGFHSKPRLNDNSDTKK
jgi:hypothetical protein